MSSTIRNAARLLFPYLAISALLALITLTLVHFHSLVSAGPGLSYAYLLVIMLAAVRWNLPHTLFALAGSLLAREFWLFPAENWSSQLGHDVHLAVFALVTTVIAVAQHSSAETRRRLELDFRINGEVARKLQGALLPRDTPIRGFQLGFLYQPAARDAHVGGDFLDVIRIDEDRCALIVGDVTGHGVSAAVEAMQVRSILETCTRQDLPPSACLALANDILCHDDRFEDQATVVYALLDARRHTVTLAAGGHEPALLWQQAVGEVIRIQPEGFLLGVMPSRSIEFVELQAPLHPGDVLLLYTDGIVEARRQGEFFGRTRLEELLCCVSTEHPADGVTAIHDRVCEFSEGPLRDDAAILMVRCVE